MQIKEYLCYEDIPRETAYKRVRNLLRIDSSKMVSSFPLARIQSSPPRPKRDVILLILESEASVFIQSCYGREDMAPEFDRLAEKGLLFSNFFSNGSHTYSGIFSTLTGLPTPPGKSIMKRMEGQQKFSGKLVQRFHLAPGAEAIRAKGGEIINIRLQSGARWTFLWEGATARIENSVRQSAHIGYYRTQQIVLEAPVAADLEIAWIFTLQ